MFSRGLRERALVADYVHGETVTSAPDLHWTERGFWRASEAQETFAGGVSGDIEANVAFEVGLKE